MEIAKDQISLNDELLENLVLSSMSASLKGKQFEEFLSKAGHPEKDTFNIQLLVEGTEFPIDEVMVEWQAQMDGMVKECALKLLTEKFDDMISTLGELKFHLLKEAGKKLGLEIKVEDMMR